MTKEIIERVNSSESKNSVIHREMEDLESFIDEAVIISKADKYGKITYVNKKFSEISGYSKEEVIGLDHNIVNSGHHKKEFWTEMYRVVIKEKKVWNSICTNVSKQGKTYHVDTYIKGKFDADGKFAGFISLRQDVTDVINTVNQLNKKNTYLEHAAKILRHDMHSGINTYIPRGLSSLDRRISDEKQKELKIDSPVKMIKEGLRHTQKVYKGVYEFTNLVKKDAVLTRKVCNLHVILDDYLQSTAYRQQVHMGDLGEFSVNESLFCTAIDNFIRNGLKYNDSLKKEIILRREGDTFFVEDNGRGMSSEDFETLSKPYARKEGQKEEGTGLGLNISLAILEEHRFDVLCDKKPEGGTQIKIKLKE